MERVADQSWSSSYTYQVSKHSAEMLSNLNNQRKNGGRFCDVILRVGDESFPAHKAVLAACSEYFESVFSCQAEDGGDSGGGAGGGGGSGGNETKELEMHTISSKVFKDILDFAYTSKIVVRLECFPELMTAAKFLLMRSVIEICQEVIKQSNVQILVPPARPDLALFRAGAPDLGYPLDMSNGSGLLANGTVFPGAHDGEVNPRGASPQALAPLPGPAPQLSPQLLAGPFPGGGASGGGLAGKRGRGRPKKIANSDPLLFGGPAIPKDVGFFPCGLCGKVFTDTSRLRNHEAQHGAAAAAAAASGGLHGLGGAVSQQQQQQQQQQQPPPSVQGPPIGLGAAIGLGDNGLALQGLPDTARKRERTRRHVGCDICGKVFRDVYHLNRHKLSHSGEKPYACPVCGLRFKRKDRMSYHVRSHDGSVGKPYVCQSCGKGFSRPDHLNGHIKQVHTSERPHKCQTCNASFATRDRLRSHLACHEDKIPCQVCGKFLRAAYMTDHLKKHSEGPHNYCSICDKDFCASRRLLVNFPDTDPLFRGLPQAPPVLPACPTSLGFQPEVFLGKPGAPYFWECRAPGFSGVSNPGHHADGQDDLQKCPHQDDNSDSSFGELSDTGELKPRHKVEESLSFQCEATASTGGKMKNEPEKKHTCSECGNSFRSKSYLNKHIQKAHAPQKALGPAGTLGELAPSLNSPFSPQQNMSLLESFGFQIVQSAFASSLVDSEAGHSSMSLGGK